MGPWTFNRVLHDEEDIARSRTTPQKISHLIGYHIKERLSFCDTDKLIKFNQTSQKLVENQSPKRKLFSVFGQYLVS